MKAAAARPIIVRWLLEQGGLLAVLVTVVYAWVASPYIVGNDNAEFATLGAVGGIAHPSGYPGYVLWLRAWSWLPLDSAAHIAALATVALAVVQVLVLHAACRAWGARPIAATLAVGLYAAAPLVVRYSTEAEAFAGNQLAVALVLWLAAANGPLRGHRRALALGLAAGLGMTNHLTCTLVAPVGILGVVRAARELPRVHAVAVATAAGGWVLGMLPYAYLFVAPQNLLGWPNPTSIGEFLDLVLRRAYGGAVGFSGSGDAVPVLAQLVELGSTLARSWLWLGLPVGLIMLAVRIARPTVEPRAGWITLALSLVVAGPILATQFDVPAAEFGLHVVHRFHLVPTLFLVIPVAVGVTAIAARVAARRPGVPRAPALQLAVHTAFVVTAALSLFDVGRYRTPAMEHMARNTLRSMPADAVIMAGGVDELDVGIRYLQLTRGERPDVLFFRWRDAAVDWYRARLVPYGLVLPAGAPYAASSVVDGFHAAGRPVFVFWWERELRARYPSYPYGVLVQLLPQGASPPPLAEVFALNRRMFEAYDLDYALPGKADEFATWVHRKYAGTWARLAEQLTAAGLHEQATVAVAFARALQPQP